jgi:hypothetical protein
VLLLSQKNFLQEKAVEATKQKEEKRTKPKPEEQKACRSASTALLLSVVYGHVQACTQQRE